MHKEMLRHIKDGRFLAATVVVLCLVAGSTWLSAENYATTQKTNYALNSHYRSSFWEADSAHLWIYANQGGQWRFVRPVQPAQVLVGGSETGADHTLRVRMRRLPEYLGDFLADPLERLAGPFDFVFVVGAVFTLVVFLLGFDALSSELSGRTLTVLLSCPVSRGTVITGKWLGGLAAVLIPYAASAAVCGLLLLCDSRVSPAPPDLVRMGAVFAVGGVYIVVMYSLAVLVSIATKGSALAALLLLVAWTVSVVAVPGMAAPLGHLAFDKVPRGATEAAVQQKIQVEMEQYIERGRLSLGVDWGDMTDEHWAWFENLQWSAFAQRHEELLELQREQIEQETRKAACARWVNRLSPFGCFQNACLALANTGHSHEERLSRYNRQYMAQVLGHIMGTTKQTYRNIDAAATPAYNPPMPGLRGSFSEAILDTVVLVLMGAVFFLSGYFLFARMELT
jgi:ABC-type transport system involved in multi-copper enzyme maturation permease subunit